MTCSEMKRDVICVFSANMPLSQMLIRFRICCEVLGSTCDDAFFIEVCVFFLFICLSVDLAIHLFIGAFTDRLSSRSIYSNAK